jgi:hypothetical protein
MLRSTSSVQHLPQDYKDFIEQLHRYLTFYIEARFDNDAEFQRFKKTFDAIPHNALAPILAIANPIKFLSGLLSLVLVKPLGRKNVMQRLIKIMFLNPLVAENQSFAKELPELVTTKITNYVAEVFVNQQLLRELSMNSGIIYFHSFISFHFISLFYI